MRPHSIQGLVQVKLNQKDSTGVVPVVRAAMEGQELLVNFMVSIFSNQLVDLRTNDTNLLNLCITNGFSERICELVARTYPELASRQYGGLYRRVQPAVAFAESGRRIPEIFFRIRDSSHDREQGPAARAACGLTIAVQQNSCGQSAGGSTTR